MCIETMTNLSWRSQPEMCSCLRISHLETYQQPSVVMILLLWKLQSIRSVSYKSKQSSQHAVWCRRRRTGIGR